MNGDLDPITPDAALEYYLDARRYDLRETTIRTHESRLRSFIDWLEEQDIQNMNEVDLRTVHAYRVYKRASPTTDDEPFRRTMGKVATAIRTPRVLAVTVLLSLNMFLYQSVTGFLPTYLVTEKGLDPGAAATLFSLFFAAAIGVQFLSGVVADRRGNRVAIAAFVGASVPAFALLTVVESFPALVGVVLLLSCLLGAMPPVNAAGLAALPPEIRGSGFGLLRTGYIAFGATGPPAVGLLADAGRFDGAFLLLGVVALSLSVWGLRFERVGNAR